MEQPSDKSYTPTQLAWQKFKANRLAIAGLMAIGLAALIAVLGATLRPDGSENANSQQLSLASKPPNFEVAFLAIRKNVDIEHTPFWRKLFFGGNIGEDVEIPLHSHTFRNDSVLGFAYSGAEGVAGRPFAFHLADVCFALGTERIRKEGEMLHFETQSGEVRAMSIPALQARVSEEAIFNRRFLLGTDKFGRDMLSRLMAGTIVSLSVGLISVLISLVLGIGLGAVAGYFGGRIDDAVTWLINVVWSIPTLLLVIAITFALGKGFVQVFIAVGLTMWVEVARVVRGQVLSLRGLEYIEAARVLGYSSFRIITRHVVPNVMGPVVVISAANFASAILLEAGLSFLGIGAQIPMASWGQMIKEHYPYITTSMAYLAVLPGACIVGLVLAFMLVGNGLRDSLDTRSTG
jgi:peptide/nickel transport system permease protein